MTPAFAHLLPLLRDPAHAACMGLADWDTTLRLARQARLLGLVAHRLAARPALWEQVPPAVQGHLRSAIHFAAHREQLMRMALRDLEGALPDGARVVLLKGAAYLAQEMPQARGRIANDVDLLVERAQLDAVEAALVAALWQPEAMDAYDQRYYREWSHELPPMRHPAHGLEVDLHHAIAPVTSRTRADNALLFDALVAVPASRFLVLDPRDQIIHAAIHLFQDTALDGRLRDLVDIDGLVRHHLATTDADAWAALVSRACAHRASHLLWYALTYCERWLATPVPAFGWPERPSTLAAGGIDWLLPRVCLPRVPDGDAPIGARVAGGVGHVRYHLLRMPPGLLLRHLAHKGWKALAERGRPVP